MNEMMIPEEMIMSKIYLIRGMKVMLDKDLAELYGVSTGNFNKAVNRNIKRFPDDFMFRLTKKEFDNLIFQIGTSSWGGTRKWPNAFTEQGVAMLSSVLHSKRAILVNIQIMRAFVSLKRMALTYTELKRKFEIMEKKYDVRFKIVFEALKNFLEFPPIKERCIKGFSKLQKE